MLPNGEAFAKNGGISSPIPDLPPPKAESDSNSNLETELLCDESFNEIIKEEVEEEEEAISSDSLNGCKRQHTDDEEEEDGNATEAVSDASKSHRIHEEEEEQNENQDSEQIERKKRRNQESEVADGGNKEDNKGEEESEQNEGKKEKETEGGNQENSNREEEINEKDENEETEEKGEEVETEELPQFSTDEEEGEKHELEEAMSKLGMWKEGRQLDVDYYDYDCDYHQTLAILRAIWNFKCKTGNFSHPPSLKLLDFIMYSLPNLKISREKLAKKIIAFKNNYNDAWELDGDNPGLDRPVDREIFNLSMQLWVIRRNFMMTGNGNSLSY